MNGFGGAVHERANAAQVRIPAPARQIMRVTDSVPKMRGFTADVTILPFVSLAGLARKFGQ